MLKDIKVVSLAINLPGPLAAARLAEFGAAVTKVEPPSGDPLAAAAPDWYQKLASRQTVVSMDLKQDDERAKLNEMLADTDILITSMRSTALERLGLARPHERFPRLSLIEIVGHSGDRTDEPGHDLNYQAAHGILTPPSMPTVPIADTLGAERAVSTALAALVERAATGNGRPYRVALEEAAERAGDAVRYRLLGEGAPLGGVLPAYRIYPSNDGYVALGAIEPHFFQRVIEVFGVDGTHEQIANAFAQKTTAELEAIATKNDIPLNAVS